MSSIQPQTPDVSRALPPQQKAGQQVSPGTSVAAAAQTEQFARVMLWCSRCLICLAVALYIVPPLISVALTALVPLLGMLSPLITTGLRSLLIVFGAMALLLVRNTVWLRRASAVTLFVAVWCVPLVVMPILSPPYSQSASQPPMSFLPDFIRVPAGLTLFFGVTYLAWNIVRNRRWWILRLSFAWSGIVGVVQQLTFFAMTSFGASPLLMTAVVVAVSLMLVVGGFGVFHLLGRIGGTTVPIDRAISASFHHNVPVRPVNTRPGYFPGYPGA